MSETINQPPVLPTTEELIQLASQVAVPTNGAATPTTLNPNIHANDLMKKVPYNVLDPFMMHYLFENPDPIVQLETRKGLAIFDEMDLDPIIAACWELITSTITGMDWEISPASNDPEDIKRKQFIEDAFKCMNGNLWKGNSYFGGFSSVLITLMDAMKMGYSIGQAIWKLDEGRIVEIQHEIPQAFYFYPAEDEQSTYKYSWTGTDLYFRREANGKLEKAPPYKFLHFIYNGRYGNPYGRSAYRKAYWPYVFGFVEGTKNWVTFLQRFADPWILGLIDEENWNNKAFVDKFMILLKDLQRSYVTTLPRTKDGKPSVELLESNRTSSNSVFSDFTNTMNRAKAIALIGTPMLIMESQYGTRAQSAVQADAVFQNFVRGWADWVMSQMRIPIQWMCDVKFGPRNNDFGSRVAAARKGQGLPVDDYKFQSEYPEFRLDYEQPDNLEKDIKIDAELVKMVPMPVSYFYDHYNRPAPKTKDGAAVEIDPNNPNPAAVEPLATIPSVPSPFGGGIDTKPSPSAPPKPYGVGGPSAAEPSIPSTGIVRQHVAVTTSDDIGDRIKGSDLPKYQEMVFKATGENLKKFFRESK